MCPVAHKRLETQTGDRSGDTKPESLSNPAQAGRPASSNPAGPNSVAARRLQAQPDLYDPKNAPECRTRNGEAPVRGDIYRGGWGYTTIRLIVSPTGRKAANG